MRKFEFPDNAYIDSCKISMKDHSKKINGKLTGGNFTVTIEYETDEEFVTIVQTSKPKQEI